MSIASRHVPVGPALFVYGTLQFPQVLTALVGRVPTTRLALSTAGGTR